MGQDQIANGPVVLSLEDGAMSLLTTAKAAGNEPRAYFRDVLLRIATCSDVKGKSLTPHGWKERWEPEVKVYLWRDLRKN